LFEYNAICTRVVDGDTIDARVDLGFSVWIECRVRLEGIDAPETRTKNLEEKQAGLKTKAFLQGIMDECGHKFVLKSHGVGKYGRCIGTIYVHGEDINQRLLAEGYAERYNK
jgi:micrococcal nuclease